MSAELDHRTPDERGLGLIELIVGVVVTSILLVGIGTILINAWITQGTVTTTSQATTRGQLIGSSIERAMRNAQDFDVLDDGSTLVVGVSLSGDITCRGFRVFTDGEGETSLMMISSDNMLDITPEAAWPIWQTGVLQVVDGADTLPIFEKSGASDSIKYTFDINTDGAPVRFSSDAATRALGDTTSCW